MHLVAGADYCTKVQHRRGLCVPGESRGKPKTSAELRRGLSIGFACRSDVQLIRHSHQFSQRSGFHLEHHTGPVNFDGLLAGTELDARLFVE